MAGKRRAAARPTPRTWAQFSTDLRAALAAFVRRLVTHLLLPVLIPAILVTLGLIGLYALQNALRGGPVLIPFADIECDAPPGTTREDFLEEVRYGDSVPEAVDLLDTARVAAAFAKSPWVERVEAIVPTPERRLRVGLTFRVPVLKVPARLPESKYWAVDRQAVLLPARTLLDGLPLYEERIEVEPTRRGAVWADPRLLAVAPIAGLLQPHQERLRVRKLGWDERGRGVLIWTTGGETILWGSPPGAERAGETPAAVKLGRLLRRGLDAGAAELDLRRLQEAP